MRYQWLPLDSKRQQIRVLDLDAGTGELPLNGSLRHVFLDTPNEACYEMISYAWGNDSLVASIWLDDERLRIPASTASALRCMRLPNKSRALWIDCICIDQHDDHEKSHQVGMMADIFQKSSCTLIYLGEDDDSNTAKQAFDGFAMIYDTLLAKNILQPGNALVASISLAFDQWYDTEVCSSLIEKLHLNAIHGILGRPYFHRIWVVQEAVLSNKKTVFCGVRSIDYNTFFVAASWVVFGWGLGKIPGYMHKEGRLRRAYSFLLLVNRTMDTLGEWVPFEGFLDQSTQLRCTDPRDRVFGLLSLMRSSRLPRTEELLKKLAPDYTKSAAEVYSDTMEICLQKYTTFWNWEKSGYEQSPDHMIENLPTWIPTWYYTDEYLEANTPKALPDHTRLWPNEPTENLSNDIALSVGRVLSVQGIAVDIIEDDTVSLPGDTRFLKGLEENQSGQNFFIDFLFREASGLLLRSCKKKTGAWKRAIRSIRGTHMKDSDFQRLDDLLTADHPDLHINRSYQRCQKLVFSVPKFRRMWSLFAASAFDADQEFDSEVAMLEAALVVMRSSSQNEADLHPHVSDLLPGAEALLQLHKSVAYCKNRKVFMTHNGLLGIGPKTLRKGDVIGVSRLSQWPMILRVLRGDHYSMVGAAFIKEDDRNVAGAGFFVAAEEYGLIGTIHLE